MTKITKGGEYTTRDGHPVRIYATDANEDYPVHGAIYFGGAWLVESWTADGRANTPTKEGRFDLIPAPPPPAYAWVSVYRNDDGTLYVDRPFSTRADADLSARRGRVGCLKIKLEARFDV